MWPDPLETAVWLHLLKKYLMGNFIFCAVSQINSFLEKFLLMKKQNSYFWIPCQSSSNITDLLTQTLNPMFRKSFYKKYIQIFCLLIFACSKRLALDEHLFSQMRNNYYFASIEGTLIQIRKSHYMFVFIWKQHAENFAFLILGIFKLLTREVSKFLKK